MKQEIKNNPHFLSLAVCWLSIIINSLIALFQFIVGFLSNSISIITDAADSLRDIIATGVVIFSLYISKKPPDSEHPFGHGRAEDIGGLIVSLFLLLVGLRFLLDSLSRLINPQPVNITPFIIIIMLSVSVIKLALGVITQKVSHKVDSEILEADAVHHYSDFITTFIVAFGLFFVKKGYVKVDSFLGFLIAFIIIIWALKMARDFIDSLIGRRAPAQIYEKLKNIALSFQFVEGVHDVEIHSYGKNKVVSLHIEISPKLSLQEAHGIADGIERKIYNENLGRCIVHVDLKKGARLGEKVKIENALNVFLTKNRQVKGFHGIEVIDTEGINVLNFHLLLDKNISLEKSHAISHRLLYLLKRKFGFSTVNIHIEPYEKIENRED